MRGANFSTTCFSARSLRNRFRWQQRRPARVRGVRRGRGFKSIEKTEPLDKTQGDDGKKTRIGDERDHAAETEACTFSESEALRIADHNGRDEVETFDRNLMHIAKIRNMQAMLGGRGRRENLRDRFRRSEVRGKFQSARGA